MIFRPVPSRWSDMTRHMRLMMPMASLAGATQAALAYDTANDMRSWTWNRAGRRSASAMPGRQPGASGVDHAHGVPGNQYGKRHTRVAGEPAGCSGSLERILGAFGC